MLKSLIALLFNYQEGKVLKDGADADLLDSWSGPILFLQLL